MVKDVLLEAAAVSLAIPLLGLLVVSLIIGMLLYLAVLPLLLAVAVIFDP